ncbi:hypothetical protein WL04_21880 [Burkholderia ubonensis]|nr:hypothetical protein WM36_24235 [Burkholderia ubonensis]KVD32842.1 hypothetical protein WI83_15810 [Burkholderia ubonensis]KVO62419.1 hypothetical protein WJ77_06165 [Burkholderia ubonensis]KVP72585.1 hypothetical protein WJ94_24825 [Burkholderia ubonensis]KVR57226.1 hypothetical protein WK19_10350 [Burkholderia ubonensis]
MGARIEGRVECDERTIGVREFRCDCVERFLIKHQLSVFDVTGKHDAEPVFLDFLGCIEYIVFVVLRHVLPLFE